MFQPPKLVSDNIRNIYIYNYIRRPADLLCAWDLDQDLFPHPPHFTAAPFASDTLVPVAGATPFSVKRAKTSPKKARSETCKLFLCSLRPCGSRRFEEFQSNRRHNSNILGSTAPPINIVQSSRGDLSWQRPSQIHEGLRNDNHCNLRCHPPEGPKDL